MGAAGCGNVAELSSTAHGLMKKAAGDRDGGDVTATIELSIRHVGGTGARTRDPPTTGLSDMDNLNCRRNDTFLVTVEKKASCRLGIVRARNPNWRFLWTTLGAPGTCAKRFEKANLTLRPAKCSFEYQEVYAVHGKIVEDTACKTFVTPQRGRPRASDITYLHSQNGVELHSAIILEQASVPHCLLLRCGHASFLTGLRLIGVHTCEVFIYWPRDTQGVYTHASLTAVTQTYCEEVELCLGRHHGQAVSLLVSYPDGSLRIFACGNRAGRCRWSVGFLGDLLFNPPFHSGAAPYSPTSPSSALKTPMLRAVQISSTNLTWQRRRAGETGDPRENPPISGIIRHDSHMRISEGDSSGNRTRFTVLEGDTLEKYFGEKSLPLQAHVLMGTLSDIRPAKLATVDVPKVMRERFPADTCVKVDQYLNSLDCNRLTFTTQLAAFTIIHLAHLHGVQLMRREGRFGTIASSDSLEFGGLCDLEREVCEDKGYDEPGERRVAASAKSATASIATVKSEILTGRTSVLDLFFAAARLNINRPRQENPLPHKRQFRFLFQAGFNVIPQIINLNSAARCSSTLIFARGNHAGRCMPLVGGFSRGSPVSIRSCIPVLLHILLPSPSSALKTSMLRAAQISSLTISCDISQHFEHYTRPDQLGVATPQRSNSQSDTRQFPQHRGAKQRLSSLTSKEPPTHFNSVICRSGAALTQPHSAAVATDLNNPTPSQEETGDTRENPSGTIPKCEYPRSDSALRERFC
ncbi:hypothetical protein PR048_033667 [Dryococelus australis]|uniref:Uncharacterized protein n=1 Tax=Dryococelus australis TaxID=614101 RepID=A0ABQ9G459_9NEOP|nr:hypothetical protein PR048_033667 [Dryococelus australis]